MSFYYSVMYSFDLSRRLVGPFKDEESCWAAMVKDANHEHVNIPGITSSANGGYIETSGGEVTNIQPA